MVNFFGRYETKKRGQATIDKALFEEVSQKRF